MVNKEPVVIIKSEHLNAPLIYSRFKKHWDVWVKPIMKDWNWYSKNYCKETLASLQDSIDALDNLERIFIVLDISKTKNDNEMIEDDHEMTGSEF